MQARTWFTSITAAVTLAVLAAGCGVSADDNASGGTSSGPVEGLRILVPNSPGSGYDTTARAAAKAMQDAKLTDTVEVFNTAGAGGTVGLQRLVNEKGKDDILMQMGLGVVGAVFTNKSKATLQDTVPIARMVSEAEAIVVPKGSPYTSLEQLVTAWKADPGKVPVGGASNAGGPDHLTPMLLAKAVGVQPKSVNYVAYDGGGELLTAVLGKKVAFAATGIGEVAEQAKSGDVKILAVTSEQPVEGIDAPTLKSLDVDLVFTNWRGIVGPPGLPAEKQQQYNELLTKMHESSQWKQTLADQGWTDSFQTGDEFKAFLTSENDRVAGVLRELGLVA
ncbi:putative tricarboxylic transport membrane protein [Kribbella orskensis]|uniref:Tricarboxylic transport membrane protein n=1 Tax=Kribbella orskensis TaxID=2512216 RepID=A0ABY2B7C7_9ACTN|nr:MULTISPECIES: tripartite tricarboxylate transporter substrate binding protein [Kribbella]TCN30047.1 putative tricarboxylic transport membrane protein [Kribbella sp. VKM Ac-2500]TCO10229.1 putative tricarboxylic transport membrane protein [Kribbella orskensis]